MLEQEVKNVRYYIDLIVSAAANAGLRNHKVNYQRVTPTCTIVYREHNLRKFKELNDIMSTHPDVTVKYPDTIIINNATSPSMLQKLILWRLSELNFSDHRNVNVMSLKTHISFTKDAYEKAQNKELIERTFRKSETETEVLFEIRSDIFEIQHQFITEPA
jgi:hypothetical protein